jgi:hypothetical protein
LGGGRGACIDAFSSAQNVRRSLRPLHRPSGGPPPPLSRGRMKQALPFSRCIFCMRIIHALRWLAFAPDRRQMAPAVGPAASRSEAKSRSPDEAKRNPGTMAQLFAQPRITLRFIRATGSERTKEKRKRNAERRCCTNLRTKRCGDALNAARPPSGVPPRLLPRGLTSPKARLKPGFLGRDLRGRYPPSPVPVQ